MNDVLAVKPLGFSGLRAWLFELGFVGFAIAFPALCHLAGWNVFALLPMHWTVLLAGLSFGPIAGALAGVVVPLANFAVSGMPVAPMLPPIAIECALYGAVPGLLSLASRRNSFLSVAAGLVAGRLGFVATMAALGRIGAPLPDFLASAFGPGAVAALLQLASLPFLATIVTRMAGKAEEEKNSR